MPHYLKLSIVALFCVFSSNFNIRAENYDFQNDSTGQNPEYNLLPVDNPLDGNDSDPIKYMINTEFGFLKNQEIRLQGSLVNVWDFETDDFMRLNISMPAFTAARIDNNRVIFSLPCLVVPAFTALHYLNVGIYYLLASEEKFKKWDKQTLAIWPLGFFVGIYSIFNWGIDFPLLRGNNYMAMTFSLNSDSFIYKMKDKSSPMYMSPKIGIKYIFSEKFGIDVKSGYRFWNNPSPVQNESVFLSVSVFVTIGELPN